MKSGLAIGLAGAVFLLPVENVFAVPTFSSSTVFSSASQSPPRTYMDQAGTWDNDPASNTEVTDTTGDTFRFTFRNTSTTDTAYDFDLSLPVPPGFILPAGVSFVNLISLTPAACSTLAGRPVSQGDPGDVITVDIPNNRDIPPGCQYRMDIGLSTNADNAFPFASACNPGAVECDVTLNIDYNLFDNTPGSQQTLSITHQATVGTSDLTLIKTALTPVASNGQLVDFRVDLINSGTGGVFNVEFTDFLSANLTSLNFGTISAFNNTTGASVSVPPFTQPTTNQLIFEYIPQDVRIEIPVRATATVNPTNTTCPDLTNDGTSIERTGVTASDFATVDFSLANSLQLTHDLANSFCELCGVGTVRLTAENIGGISLTNVIVYEDLRSSGLTYVPGTVQISIDGAAPVPASDPEPDPLDPLNPHRFRWTPTLVPELAQLDSPFAVPAPPNPISIEFIFQVERAPGFNEEGLAYATTDRRIIPNADYDLICGGISESTTGALVELPIRQGVPVVIKRGRNIDAGQGAYDTIVYGHVEDSVIWQVEIQNTGLANLEDIEIDDVIGGNFDINWVCNSEANAVAASTSTGGPTPAGCISTGGGVRTFKNDVDLDDTTEGTAGFTTPNNDEPVTFIDVATANSTFVYYVGRVQGDCSLLQTNTVDIEWGCEADSPAGGLIQPGSNGGALPAYDRDDSADLSSQVDAGMLTVQQTVTGINPNQPVGSSGLVTVTLTNDTGSTVRDIVIQDILPAGQYVVDSTFTPTVVVTPAYGTSYDGMIDTVSSDIDTTPANLLNNTQPTFTFTSSTQRSVSTLAGDDRNLLRHGDELILQFRIVLRQATRYDLFADITVTPEEYDTLTTSPDTDPVNQFTIANEVRVDFSNICTPVNPTQIIDNQNFPVFVEDLDVNISSTLFILTNDVNTPVTLDVLVTNNGGHDADNHVTYVTFGPAMTVQNFPAGICTGPPTVTNPPPHPVWNQPAFIPPTATVFACDAGVIAPGATVTYSFDVVKTTLGSPIDDLTFRADVIGEVTLFDGTPLTLPAPASIANTTPNQQLANNYSLDTFRSQVLGFNLTHSAWYCTESGAVEPPAPAQSDDLLTMTLPSEFDTQIGEDCHYFVEAGGWFGFLTDGYNVIAVQEIDITAQMDGVLTTTVAQGLGMIPFAPGEIYDFHGTNQDNPINLTPDVLLNLPNGGATSTSLDQSPINWAMNNIIPGQEITEKDKFFRVNYKARLLNTPVDGLYLPPIASPYEPNLHGRTSSNIAVASFRAIFQDPINGTVFDQVIDENSIFPGYPAEPVRRVDLTVVEPNLTVTKTVCNETVTNTIENHDVTAGPLSSCSNYQPVLSDGDTNDRYVYRISITNESLVTTPNRSPAYDLIVTDVLDISDLMLVEDFANDDLDNDDDGLVDEADEATILTDNILNNANPAEIQFHHSDVNTGTAQANASLLRIDAGETINLYYRVNPSDEIAPLQPLNNTVNVQYDSLEGDFGNQNSPQLDNTASGVPNATGRARIYNAPPSTATVIMEQLVPVPKVVTATSHTALTASPPPQNQDVSIGEEVRYRLETTLPVADLDNFRITDELPRGVRCVATNYPDVVLSPVTFDPGGTFTPVCTPGVPGTATRDVIVWDFDNQEVISGPVSGVPFAVEFVARVENTLDTSDPDPTVNDPSLATECVLTNGGSFTGGDFSTPTLCSTEPTLAVLTYTETFTLGGTPQTVEVHFAQSQLVVREPLVSITKEFLPVVNADAQDILTVNVSIVNNGSAPAYNVQVLDDLTGTKFNYVVGSEATSGLPDASVPDVVNFVGGDNDRPVFNWNSDALAGYQLDPGDTISFVFQVEVDDVADAPRTTGDPHVVEPHDVILNNLEVKWTSLEDNTTGVLNASGSIGADGEALGMRIGYVSTDLPVPPPVNAANDYNDANSSSVTVPSLTFAKADQNPPVPPQPETVKIGEHKQFRLDIGFPEGITNALTIVDDLNVTGDHYILENEPGLEITYQFDDIFSINGTDITAMAPADVEALFTSFPDDADTSGLTTATWVIGAVDTLAEDDQVVTGVNPAILIDYFARVDNSVDINAGDTLQNSATLTYNNVDPSTGFTRTTNTQTVVEPKLLVTREVANITKPLPAVPTVPPDAGDVLEYTITIQHDLAQTNQTSAFDLNIQENLPVGVTLTGTPVITIDGVPTGDVVPTVGVNTLVWGRTNTSTTPGGDETLDLLFDEAAGTGQVLVLTYRVVVDAAVEPNQDLDGTVVVDWTSLQGASAFERFGNGGATCTITDQNDYCISDNEPLLVSDLYNITKTANNDSWNDTLSTANDGNLRVGDTVEYTLSVNMQEGTTTNIVIEDDLPNGMEFVGIVSINGDFGNPIAGPPADVEYVDTAADFTYLGDGRILASEVSAGTGGGVNTVVFNIGDVIADADNITTNNDFVIVYTAQVVNAELPIPQTPTTPLTNIADFNYDDVNNVRVPQTDSASINTMQPQILLADIVKERFDSGYLNTIASGSPASAGSTVYFRLTACNSGDAPAYDVELQDHLDPVAGTSVPQAPALASEFDLSTLSTPVVRVNGALVTEGAANDYTYTVNAAGLMTFNFHGVGVNPVSQPDNCIEIDFDIQVHTDLASNNSWDNSFQLNSYASLDADDVNAAEREVYASVVGPVLVNLQNLDPFVDPAKSFTSVSQPDSVLPLTARGATFAAVGELVTYRIEAPASGMLGALNNMIINDTLDDALTFSNVTLVPPVDEFDYGDAPGETINTLGTLDTDVQINLDATLTGSHTISVDLEARVNNDADANIATPLFDNEVVYQFNNSASPAFSNTVRTLPINDITIVEPQLDPDNPPTITVTNLTKALPAVDAGDILQYTITYEFLGGAADDRYSDAYDISITSDIGPGLAFVPNSATSTVNAPAPLVGFPQNLSATDLVPNITGNVLTWSIVHDNETDIDVPEGGNAEFTFQVVVQDSVLATETLTNTTVIRWTSLDDDINDVAEAFERDGSGGINNYFSADLVANVTTTDTNTVTKSLNANTSPLVNSNDVRIGDIVDYRLRLRLQEGTSRNVTITDVLPQGLQFEGIVSIDNDIDGTNDYSPSAPISYSPGPDLAPTVVSTSGDPTTGPTTVTWALGDIINAGFSDANDGPNNYDIIYRARVLNLVQTPLDNPASNIPLNNNVQFYYETGIGDSRPLDSETITLQQPNLSIINKSVFTPDLINVPANPAGDLIIGAGETVTYTVDIQNNGLSPAYDVRLEDVIPAGLRQGGISIVRTEMPIGSILPADPLLDANVTYDAGTGLAVIDFDTGVPNSYRILSGETLRIVYEVTADTTIGAGLTGIVNTALVRAYHSFDNDIGGVPATADFPPVTGVREIYGPSNAASSPGLNTLSPTPLLKQNPFDSSGVPVLEQSIGVPFTYRITVPETPAGSALYDVKITDGLYDLSITSPFVELGFVSVTKATVFPLGPPANPYNTGSWTPVGTLVDNPAATSSGDTKDLLIEDPVNGIDIPAGEQVILDVTVVLKDLSANEDGDSFINSAEYTYNSINDDPTSVQDGGLDSDVALTIVEPLTMVMNKTAPAFMTFGTPGSFTLDVQNTGNGPAYDLTIVDNLTNQAEGGICDTPPVVTSARVFQADGTTPVSIPLIENTHFVTSHVGDPTCTFTITMTAPEAELLPANRLIVTFDAMLDVDSFNTSTVQLNNVAGVTEWFSADTPAGVKVGEIRRYFEDFSTTDPGTNAVVDHEDIASYDVRAPDLDIQKAVTNLITGSTVSAEPGESVRYSITIDNNGPVPATNFSLTDEPDRLNGVGYFVSGSMSNIVVSQGDISNTDINAGNNAAGILDVRNLTLSEDGGGNDVLTISFDMTLQNILEGGTPVDNQAEVALTGFSNLVSYNPNVNPQPQPADNRVTRFIIGSVPVFDIRKSSQDITGDTSVLRTGDIIRYTITAKNIAAENSINTYFRDQIPANTTYVPNTTTLNGVGVADPAAGVSPVEDGMLINAPETPTPGVMNIDPGATTHTATITFDVQVNENVVNGTVISNQGFVGGEGVGSGPYAEQPSDDPDTEIKGDPTRDVVGNVAIIDAQKTVELSNDQGNLNELDSGDTLTYTITVNNYGAIPATGVVLTDITPSGTSYVAGSTTLNGNPVTDTGVLPISTGMDINSSGQAAGVIAPMQSAVLVFEVTVDGSVNDGDLITNQATVESNEFPLELSDEDGNDLNGDQPTEIYAGAITQQLSISKEVFVVGGGTAQPGKLLEFFITVENTGTSAIDLTTFPVATNQVLKIHDDIDQAGLLSYEPGSVRVDGFAYDEGTGTAEVTYSAPRLTVNYDLIKQATSSNYMFKPGARFTVRYLARINSGAAQGTNIANSVALDWGVQDYVLDTATYNTPAYNSPSFSCQNVIMDACTSVNIEVGGAPGVGNISGNVWHDSNYDTNEDTDEVRLESWEVQIYFGLGTVNAGEYLDSVYTDANGDYSVLGLIPVNGDIKKYALQFLPPGATANSASMGTLDVPGTVPADPVVEGLSTLTNLDVSPNSHTVDINLPIQPNGVVYNAVLRTPVPGAELVLENNAGPLDASCFRDPKQQNQVTATNGYYRFDPVNLSAAGCDLSGAGDRYEIKVYPPSGYFVPPDPNATGPISVVSSIIPPALPLTGPAYDVDTCNDDAITTTTECEVLDTELAPQNDPNDTTPRDERTKYYLHFTFGLPVKDEIYNNHIPLDPELDDAISISKTSAMVNVTRGQLVPYTITLNNTLAAPIYDLNLLDIFPPGFKYVAGSARIQFANGAWVKVEPEYIEGNQGIPDSSEDALIEQAVNSIDNVDDFREYARVLAWNDIGTIDANSIITLKLLLVVGSGVGEGEYVNRAVAANEVTTGAASRVAQATVRVVPDPTFDCADIIGKVFDDRNMNSYQDEGEPGIPGARVITPKGLEVTADKHGRFNIACAVVPNQDRGSNFILKLDERSLPTGYRLTTENPRVVRATRGKMAKFNFGAAIHRVVRLDMADPVFEPGTTEMRPQWLPRIDLLMTELAKDPSVLRLSYLAENESPSEVDDRLDAVKSEIEKRWEALNCCYQLTIETEVFWRKGGPPDRGEFDE